MTIQLNNISSDLMEMLSQHRQSLKEQIRQLQEHEAIIQEIAGPCRASPE